MQALPRLSLLFTIGALTPAVQAQDFSFTSDQSSSNYTWSGTTSLGPLNGNPSNTFQLSGTLSLELGGGGAPVGSGQWISTDLLVVPDLSGIIPNPIQGLPPLATIDVEGMRFSISSDPFSVDGAGAFDTTTVLEVTSGLLTVTPLVGAATMTDLTGTMGDPTPTSGTITRNGSDLEFASPMNTQFDFTDTTSGISATINLNGNLVADYTCEPAANYCGTSPNSVGAGAVMGTSGSTFMADNNFSLTASGAPANKPGLFFVGPNQVSVPLGDGVRCVGGSIKRLGVVFSNGSGVFDRPIDFTSPPNNAVFEPGVEYNFQCWYRDQAAGGAGFNLSDATNVTFCP